ncbi:MAG: molybdopterin-dependent oxidoreductase [Rhodospirillales bacterium]
MQRRTLLAGLGAVAASGTAAQAAQKPTWMSPALPEGTRDLATMVRLPGKQPLIQLTDRPPNYETPIDAFASATTPNDRFFIRYHLAAIPTMDELKNWSLTVGGDATERSATLTMADLRKDFAQTEIAAVCQCSGNRRGLFDPHVPGVEWGYGAMGSALWRGVRLKDVLAKAGIKPGALEVWFGGADVAVMPGTPKFLKSIPAELAQRDDVLIATAMNGQPLPHMNGYPARLIVPGWTGTYWMKHLTSIEVSTKPLPNFWTQKAYRVPAGMFPVDLPFVSQNDNATWPITEMVVNSVVAAPLDGAKATRSGFTVRGVAWDRGHGIATVEVSFDGGTSWKPAVLDKELGKYAFRGFSLASGALPPGPCVVSARAVSNKGEQQSTTLVKNPAGYHHNLPQTLTVTVA